MALRPIYPESIEPSSTSLDVMTTLPDGTVGWAELPPPPVVPPATRWEVVMASGVTPAVPLESSDGYDWLYGEVPA